MTKQARLENSLLLILKRGSWTTWCRKVKICWRLSWEGNRWEWRRRGRLTRPGGPDKIVQELICRKGRESVVHHPCNQIPQLVSDCWFDLLQHLLTMIIEELVDGVGQQLILPVKQVVHVDYHLPNLEVKVGVNNLSICFPSASSTGTILENTSAVTSIIFVVKEPEPSKGRMK